MSNKVFRADLVARVAARPALGLGLGAAPLLYVVWANSRYALSPALDPARPASAHGPSRRVGAWTG